MQYTYQSLALEVQTAKYILRHQRTRIVLKKDSNSPYVSSLELRDVRNNFSHLFFRQYRRTANLVFFSGVNVSALHAHHGYRIVKPRFCAIFSYVKPIPRSMRTCICASRER